MIPFSELAALFGQVTLMSVLAFGGALAILPDLRRVLVTNMQLLTETQFTDAVALAQASPGPNVLFVAVMGYQAAGLAGAGAMLLAFLLPCSTLAYAGLRWGAALGERRPMRAFKAAMAPIVIALILSSGWILSGGADALHVAVTAVTALLVWRTRIHVVAFIAAGGLAGALGWL